MLKQIKCSSKRAFCNQRKRAQAADDDDQIEQVHTNACLKHPRPLIIILIICTAFSILSTIDCHFVTVHVGFVPANVKIETTSLDAGVFSFQDSNFNHGKCSYNVDPYRALGFNKVFGRYQQIYDKIIVGRGDGSSKFVVPGDKKWTAVRVSSIISAASYAMTLVLALLTEVSRYEFPVETLSNLIFLAAIFESFKFGCMFLIEMCVSAVWLDNTLIRTEGSYLKSAQSCEMGRSGMMTVAVLAISVLTLFATHRKKKTGRQQLPPSNPNGIPTQERIKSRKKLRRSSSLFVNFFNFSSRLSSREKTLPTTINLDNPLGDSTNSLRSAIHYSRHEKNFNLHDEMPLVEGERDNDTRRNTGVSKEKKTSPSQSKLNISATRNSSSYRDESGLAKKTNVENDKNDSHQTSKNSFESKPPTSTTLQSEPYHRVGNVLESCEYGIPDEYSESDEDSDQDYLNEITPLTGGDQYHNTETNYLTKPSMRKDNSSELDYASDKS